MGGKKLDFSQKGISLFLKVSKKLTEFRNNEKVNFKTLKLKNDISQKN